MFCLASQTAATTKVTAFKHCCQKCHHSWLSELEHPVSCPSCKDKNWTKAHRWYWTEKVGPKYERTDTVKNSEHRHRTRESRKGFFKSTDNELHDEFAREKAVKAMYIHRIRNPRLLITLNMPLGPELPPLYQKEESN
jgi:hypothetical protein